MSTPHATKIAPPKLSSSRALGSLSQSPKRNLGCGILLAAIEDYQSTEEHTHSSAARFLYPRSEAYRTHYEWVVSMAAGVDPAWLREALDSAREEWDRARREAILREIVRRRQAAQAAASGCRVAAERGLSPETAA